MTDAPAAPASDSADAARDRRKRRWDRVTLAAIAAMVVIWGVALLFRNEIRSAYWSWRLARAEAPAERMQWAASLASLGPTAAEAAIRLTGHADAEVRATGAQVLAHLARQDQVRAGAIRTPLEKRAADCLAGLLADPDPDVAAEAVAGLDLLGDADSLPPLADAALDARDESVACLAAAAVGRISTAAESLAHLERLVRESEQPNVKAEAIDHIGRTHCNAPLTILVEALSDVREVTVRPASERADPALLAAVQRAMARQGLPLPLSPTTAPAATRPDRMTVADYAVEALRRLTGREFGFDARAPAADREAAVERWRAFVRDKGV